MKKIITFYHQKTSGNTLLALNSALLAKQMFPQKKIAFLQADYFPDAHHFIGLVAQKNYAELIPFLPKDIEPKILEACKSTQQIDFFFSPTKTQWEVFSSSDFLSIINTISYEYDWLVIDISAALETEKIKIIAEKSDHFFCTTFQHPAHLESLQTDVLLDSISEKNLIVNQSSTANFLDQQFLERFSVPVETESLLWIQVYEGVPLVFQKKSKIKKALTKIVESWI